MANYTVNILKSYYKSLNTDPCSIYKASNHLQYSPDFCNCQNLISYIMQRDHYNGYGGPHRTQILDKAERELESCMISNTFPNNRSTYVINNGVEGDDDEGPGILVFMPIRNFEELHLVLCYNIPSIIASTSPNYAMLSAQSFSNDKDLALIIGCRVFVDMPLSLEQTDNILIQPKKYTPRYLMAIRSPTEKVGIVAKFSWLFVSAVLFLAYRGCMSGG